MSMPNFLIIGAAKAGTSSIHSYLSQHPQIYMSPIKEPMFFAYENELPPKFRGMDEDNPVSKRAIIRRRTYRPVSYPITRLSDYQKLFAKAYQKNAIGESTPLYLYSERAAERIQHHIPHARIIAVLRNPVERAYSHYSQFRKNGYEDIEDFGQALEMEHTRILRNWSPGWFYKQRGLYHQQLKRYFDRFDKNQLRVYLYDNFSADPMGILRDIFRFLDVAPTFKPDLSMKLNVSSGIVHGPKHETLDRFLNNPNPVKSILKKTLPTALLRRIKTAIENLNIGSEYQFVVPRMSEEIRKKLQNDYRDDILHLQDLIGQDLSRWLA
jgi:hypothetical protein